MALSSLAVFCGSRPGINPIYLQHATELGSILARRNVTMIYGGGKKGLMGCIADSAMHGGGSVKGVIPRVLIEWEHQHDSISELMVVDDMHIRKRKLYELCDAAIILPGGFGTLDELFEILTWNQLSIHDKKIFIMNSGGFYDHLLTHMHKLAAEGFLYGNLDEQITVLNEPGQLAGYIG